MDNRRFNNRNDSDFNQNSRNDQSRFLNPDQNYRNADADFNYRSADMDSNRGSNYRSQDMDSNRDFNSRASNLDTNRDYSSRSSDRDYNRDLGYTSSEMNYDRDQFRRDSQPSYDQNRWSSSYSAGQQNRDWSTGDRSSIQNDRSFDQGRFDYGRNRSSSYSDRDRSQDGSGWNDRSTSYMGRQENSNRQEGFMESAKDAVKSFFGKGPKGYQRSDERIKEDVSEALYRHHGIDASEIEVAVKAGTVTLTGTVPDRSAKRLAEDIAEGCTGVTNVSNLLMVDPNFGSQSQSQSTASQTSTTGTRSKSIQ